MQMDESERVRAEVERIVRSPLPKTTSTRQAGRDLNRLRAEQARRKAADERARRTASKRYTQPKR